MATRYRLPDALGGGEYECIPNGGELSSDGKSVAFDLPGLDHVVWLPNWILTEVKPPLPEEPPIGTVVLDRDGVAWQAHGFDDHPASWFAASEAADEYWAGLNNNYGPLTRLVPDPFAEPVEFPWRALDPYSRQHVEVRLSDTDWRDNESDEPPRRTVAWVTAGDRLVGSHLSAPVARDMARALWAAADQWERAS